MHAWQDLVYGRKFDHGIRQAAKLGGTPEQVFEQEPVKEAWQAIVREIAKELEERNALQRKAEEEPEQEEKELATVRKAPTSFPLHSASYWRAVANQTVRTYITLVPEPKTLEGVVTAIEQSSLKSIAGTQGSDSVLVFLDMDSLGESQGPGARKLLRRKFTADLPLLRKLIQGAMLARGSQKRENSEATRVVEGDLVMIHDGLGHPGGVKEAKNMFRLSSAKKEADLDSEVREVLIVFDDESIRQRKQRVKGSYTSHTTLLVASAAPLAQSVPERAYEHHPGHTTSNIVHGVKALAPADMWFASRTDNCNALSLNPICYKL